MGSSKPSFGSGELDTLARAFQRAIDALPPSGVDLETARKLMIGSLLEAADRGVTDEDILTDTAIAVIAMYRQTRREVQKRPF
jgi:hypothetical protein